MPKILALLTLLACAAGAQTPPVAPAEPAPVTVREPAAVPTPAAHGATAAVSVGYVLVPFVVTDTKGRAIRDLKKKDVTLLVEGAPVATDLFDRSDQGPVSFAILLDGSGSMALSRKMEGARAAIRSLVARGVKGDDYALYVFSEGQVREVVPFTTNGATVTAALSAVVPFGKTALFDAIAKMPDRTLLGKNGARAIVLLTDGLDNASKVTEADLTALLEGIDVPVYPFGLRATDAVGNEPPPGQTKESLLNLDILGHIARMSGGRLEVVTEPDQLEGAVQEMERDLRFQYLLGFTPTGSGPVRYRRLSLRLTGRPRVVRVRAGYRGSEPPYQGKTKP